MRPDRQSLLFYKFGLEARKSIHLLFHTDFHQPSALWGVPADYSSSSSPLIVLRFIISEIFEEVNPLSKKYFSTYFGE
jgi:hypothetical protein